MKKIIVLIVMPFIVGYSSKAGSKKTLDYKGLDTFYIVLPNGYDTVDVHFFDPNIISFVADQWHLKDFKAPGEMSLDFSRTPDFVMLRNRIPRRIAMKTISFGRISDSLILYKRDFFKRHVFFVIISKRDTAFFYRAKGEYMYKNFDNDVQYDSTKKSAMTNDEREDFILRSNEISLQLAIIRLEELNCEYQKTIINHEIQLLKIEYPAQK